MDRFLREVSLLSVAVASLPFLAGCSTPIYLVKLGWAQARIVSRSRPNERVLTDGTVEESTKEKIRLVMEVKAYAEDRLGLEGRSSFSTYYEVEDPALLYVVSASPRDRLEPYRWRFPVVGVVTTKGFFSRQDALRERDRLERRGFDVFVQGAQAYSTLGWFKDPIFSTMLDQDRAMIVYVVIHELTHATVFFKSHLDFNEQIATFVGLQGAVDFTGVKFGTGSFPQRQARAFMDDSLLFAGFMGKLQERLQALYAKPIPLAAKLQRREAIFLDAKSQFGDLKGRLKTQSFLGFERLKLNNAVVLALGRYISRIDQIREVYESLGRDLAETVLFFKELKKRRVQDPETYITAWLRQRQGNLYPGQAHASS